MKMYTELKLGRISDESFNEKAIEILAALQKLGERVSVAIKLCMCIHLYVRIYGVSVMLSQLHHIEI